MSQRETVLNLSLQLDKGAVVYDVTIIGDRDIQKRQALLERSQIRFTIIHLRPRFADG